MTVTESRPTAQKAILAACERALAKYGYRRTTMETVADEAKRARRTIYLHFPNKEALVVATIEGVVARTQAAMREPLSEGTGLDSLRGMLAARILVRLEQVGPFHHSLDDVYQAVFPHSSEEYLSYYEPEVLLLVSAIEKGIADRSIAAVDARAAAELLVRATNGFLPSNLTRAEAASVDSVRIKLGAFVDMLSYGIALRTTP